MTEEAKAEDVTDVVGRILTGSGKERIAEVAGILKVEGVDSADDLKYFDWTALESTRKLTDMEVKKIMRFLRTNHPAEYEEHKRRKDEEYRLRSETELLNLKIHGEEEIAKSSNEFSPELSSAPASKPAPGVDEDWEYIGDSASDGREDCDVTRETGADFLSNFLVCSKVIVPPGVTELASQARSFAIEKLEQAMSHVDVLKWFKVQKTVDAESSTVGKGQGPNLHR